MCNDALIGKYNKVYQVSKKAYVQKSIKLQGVKKTIIF